jgi:hypothetical protein
VRAVRIGIIGRDSSLLRQALELGEGAGHDARGTLDDAEALAWVRAGQVNALLIGGGVEPASRDALVAACEESDVRSVLVSGPGVLGDALLRLSS